MPAWQPVHADHLPLISGLELTGFVGLVAATEAFRGREASVIAPFEYTALAWGLGIDWLFWNALPVLQKLLGGAKAIGPRQR